MSFFRTVAPPAPGPSRADRLERMRNDVASLERRRDALRARVDGANRAAQQHAAAGDRSRAADALRERRRLNAEMESTSGVLSNLSAQLSTVETAHTTASVAQSMRDGAALMRDVERDLDATQLHGELVEMRTNARRLDKATSLMARPLLDDAPLDAMDMDAELAALMETATMESVNVSSVDDDVEPPSVTRAASQSTADVERELGL